MEISINIHDVYAPTNHVVAREISGELVLIPAESGIVDSEVEIITLNASAYLVWTHLDGKKTISEVSQEVGALYEALPGQIEHDVCEFMQELLKRAFVSRIKPGTIVTH